MAQISFKTGVVDFFLCVNKRGNIFLFAKRKIIRISPLLSFVRLFRVDILYIHQASGLLLKFSEETFHDLWIL